MSVYLRRTLLCVLGLALLLTSSIASADDDNHHPIKRVLLLSVDGLHAVDLANFVKSNPGSALAGLSHHGITYSNASAAKPSDSFPGLLALVTGGSPVSTGVWYDDSYDRKLSAPGSNCSVVGTEVVYDESIDNDNSQVNGGGGI